MKLLKLLSFICFFISCTQNNFKNSGNKKKFSRENYNNNKYTVYNKYIKTQKHDNIEKKIILNNIIFKPSKILFYRDNLIVLGEDNYLYTLKNDKYIKINDKKYKDIYKIDDNYICLIRDDILEKRKFNHFKILKNIKHLGCLTKIIFANHDYAILRTYSNLIKVKFITDSVDFFKIDGLSTSDVFLLSKNKMIIKRYKEKKIKLYDFEKEKFLKEIKVNQFDLRSKTLSKEYFIFVDQNGILNLINIDSDKIYKLKTRCCADKKNMILLPDNKLIFVYNQSYKPEKIYIWDFKNSKLKNINLYGEIIVDIKNLNKDEIIILTAKETIIIWDWKKNKIVKKLKNKNRRSRSLGFQLVILPKGKIMTINTIGDIRILEISKIKDTKK